MTMFGRSAYSIYPSVMRGFFIFATVMGAVFVFGAGVTLAQRPSHHATAEIDSVSSSYPYVRASFTAENGTHCNAVQLGVLNKISHPRRVGALWTITYEPTDPCNTAREAQDPLIEFAFGGFGLFLLIVGPSIAFAAHISERARLAALNRTRQRWQ